MNDLISKAELINYIKAWDIGNGIMHNQSTFIDEVNAQEVVDAVQVVRCKDCDMLQKCKISQYLGLDGYCSNADMRKKGNDMGEFYKPLTPDFRKQINDSIEKNIKELRTCEKNGLVQVQICGQMALKNLIRSLPDGYLIPMKK